MKTPGTKQRNPERGAALVTTFLVLVLMLTMGAAGMVYSVLDNKSTAHYNTGNQAFYAAESGLMHALNVINQPGVVDFNDDIVDSWNTKFTPNPQTISGYPNLTYQVAVAPDPVSPTTKGLVTSTGTAPGSARRIVRAVVQRDTTATGRGRGAIYLAADSVTSQFSGNAFNVDGNDHDQFGALVPGGVVEPGIGTRNDTVTSDVKSSLNSSQMDNVQGLEFTQNPLNPSVVTTGGPNVLDLDQVVADILAKPGVVTSSSSSINGNQTWGTVASPQITHLTAESVKIHANGNASGAGILIVDGSFTINGAFDFIGWIIVRGDTIINDGYNGDDTEVLGNATILGSLWTGDLVVRVGGSAIVNYCAFCMTLADGTGGGSGNIPRPVKVLAWEEIV